METSTDRVEEVAEFFDLTVPLYKLASSPTNPRTSFPADTMAELTASVKEHGVIQPLLLRAWPDHYAFTGDKPVYEIVAGERRFRAAKAAGLTEVPYLLRELTDDQVLQIQIIENLQREDLHPLEEAEGYQKMMRDHGYSAEDLAEQIGKSRSYIFGRLKLLDLDEDSRRLFANGILNASTALLVARIPSAKLRAKAIKEITTPDHTDEAMSVRKAQEYLQNRYMLKLVEAKFPIDDATLPGGSCVDCPKRTGNAGELFPDVKSSDVCTDPDCFAERKQAHFDRQIEEAGEKGITVILGKDAAEIAPYGTHHQYVPVRGYLRDDQLDEVCEDDDQGRTYREIIGDSVKPTLIEDKGTQTLTACIPNTILADKLREAGIATASDRRHEQEEQARQQREVQLAANKQKYAAEQHYRESLFSTIRSKVIELTPDGVPAIPYDAAMAIFRRAVAVAIMAIDDIDDLDRVAKMWLSETEYDACGRDNGGLDECLLNKLPSFNDGEIWQILVDILVIAEVNTTSAYMLDEPAQELTGIAGALSIDMDDFATELARKAAEEAQKQTAETSAEASPTTEAAQAQEPARDENGGLAVGDRVRIRNDIATGTAAWRRKVSGREGVIEAVDGACLDVRVGDGKAGLVKGLVWNEVDKLEPGTEAAQAGDQAVEQVTDETPTGTGDGEGDAEPDLIETNEKPKRAARRPILYRHPDYPLDEWTGRGKEPKWVEDYLAIEGNTLEGLKVAA